MTMRLASIIRYSRLHLRGAMLVAMLLLLAACGRDRGDKPIEMTPQAGAVAMPTSVMAEGAPAAELTEPTPAPLVFVTGDQLQAAAAVRMYADAATSSLVLDRFDPGALFTVVEPSGDYGAYPVENQGEGWVRVRSDDGLVGWVRVADVAPAQ